MYEHNIKNMKMTLVDLYNFRAKVLLLVLVVLTNVVDTQLSARDSFIIGKGQFLVQTGPSAVSQQGWFTTLSCEVSGISRTTNVVVTPPGRNEITLPWDWDGFYLNINYTTKTALDADIPNGTFVVKSYADGSATTTAIGFTGDSYPVQPQFLNFIAAQGVNSESDFTLSWNQLGLTSSDYVKITIYDCNDESVFETPDPFMPGALNGLATSLVIPANTLYPGLTYSIELIAAKLVNAVTNRAPDGNEIIIISTYFKVLRMPLTTIGAATPCFSWETPIFVFQFPNGTIQGTNVHYTTPANVSQYNMVFSVRDQNPPNSVTFSGPSGSGLNNTPSSWSGTGDWSSFGSPFIYLPNVNVLTGGVYTINYKGVNLKFNFSNPQIEQRQIFLVPEFVVDNLGVLRQIRWSYKDQSGKTVAPQDFMDSVRIIVRSGWGGELFSTYNLRPAITNYAVTNTVVKWDDVSEVQIGFEDNLRGSYVMHYEKSSAPSQLQILTDNFNIVQGTSVSVNLTASGGVTPYRWRINLGYLPSGLTLDELSGVIQGVPGVYGNYKVNIKLIDAVNSEVTKDIYFYVVPGTYNERIAFTNTTRVNGMPAIQAFITPQQIYTLEISTNLQTWTPTYVFRANSVLSEQLVLPSVFFNQYKQAFFRLKLGPSFGTQFSLTHFATAGTINPNAPYNVIVNYPVVINSHRAVFLANYDPEYAALGDVYFTPPNGGPIYPEELRTGSDNQAQIRYSTPSINGAAAQGQWIINYKGTNFTFNVNSNAILSNLVVPVPVFTVSNGNLTKVSWNYRNPGTGSVLVSAPSFMTTIQVQIDDGQGNRIYNSDELEPSVTSHTLSQTINWSSVSNIYMAYDDNADNHFVITYHK